TGHTPFEGGTVAQKLIWHQTRQPKPIRALRPEVPEELAAVADKMMAKEKAQRYQTPAEVVEALAPWTKEPIPPPPEKEMPRLSPAAMGSSMVLSGASAEPVIVAGPVGSTSSGMRKWEAAPRSPSPLPQPPATRPADQSGAPSNQTGAAPKATAAAPVAT